jgi:hypothetical protein
MNCEKNPKGDMSMKKLLIISVLLMVGTNFQLLAVDDGSGEDIAEGCETNTGSDRTKAAVSTGDAATPVAPATSGQDE